MVSGYWKECSPETEGCQIIRSYRDLFQLIRDLFQMLFLYMYTCQYILLPYNFEWVLYLFPWLDYIYVYIYPTFLIHICVWNRFHWILLIIEIDRCRVRVYDSLRKPTYYYQDLINIIQKAWACFLEKHIGISSSPAPLEFTTNWPVQIHIAHLLSFL